jgi:hypothetical protein
MAFILLKDVRRQKSNNSYKSGVAQGGHMNKNISSVQNPDPEASKKYRYSSALKT